MKKAGPARRGETKTGRDTNITISRRGPNSINRGDNGTAAGRWHNWNGTKPWADSFTEPMQVANKVAIASADMIVRREERPEDWTLARLPWHPYVQSVLEFAQSSVLRLHELPGSFQISNLKMKSASPHTRISRLISLFCGLPGFCLKPGVKTGVGTANSAV